MRRELRAQPVEVAIERVMLARLHQTEMAARQRDVVECRQIPQHRQIRARGRLRQHRAMPLAADLVEDHAGNADIGMMPLQPLQQRRRRRADAFRAQHQHDWQLRQRRDLRRRARCEISVAGGAVEQAHHAFDDQQLRIMRGLPHQMRQRRRPHRPAIEIEARPPGRARMELRIDIVRPHLARRHRDAAPLQQREQRQRDRGLATAGRRGGDDEALGGHCALCLPQHRTPLPPLRGKDAEP